MTNAKTSSLTGLKQRRIIGKVAFYVLGLLVAVIVCIPFYWMIITSLKGRGAIMSIPVEWIPKEPTLDAYKKLFAMPEFVGSIFNSFYVSVLCTAVRLLCAAMAAFALTKIPFKGRNAVFGIYVTALMIPSQITFIPLFIIMTAAAFFSWILTREGLSRLLQTAMTGFAASYSETALVLMCVLVFLIVGCFMDTSAAVLLLAPIIIPVVKSVGIDPIYFGVLMVLGLMVGIITPPFGICLFVVSGVAKIPVKDVTKEAIRYIPAMVAVILLVVFFPQIVTFIPNTFFN